MAVVIAAALAILLLLVGVGVNLGYWSNKRTVVQEAAETVASAALRNQLTYRSVPGNPNTRQVVGQVVAEGNLAAVLRRLNVTYEFGLALGGTFTSAGGDPNPATTPFNSVVTRVCTPLDDVTGTFAMEAKRVCGEAQATVDLSRARGQTCCNRTCESKPLVARLLCNTDCLLGGVLDLVGAVLNFLFSLDAGDLLVALNCVLETLVVTIDSVVDFVFGNDAVTLEYTAS